MYFRTSYLDHIRDYSMINIYRFKIRDILLTLVMFTLAFQALLFIFILMGFTNIKVIAITSEEMNSSPQQCQLRGEFY